MEENMIAPCGMNCALCLHYQSMQNGLNRQGFHKTYCPGCLPRGKNCLALSRSCTKLANGLVRFCYLCGDFPCARLKALDKRYRTQYHMSMIQNLRDIQENGMDIFLQKEEEKWRCPDCGGVVCCHNGLCLACNLDTLRQNKKYRWGER